MIHGSGQPSECVVVNQVNVMMIEADVDENMGQQWWAELITACANGKENVTISLVCSVSAQKCLTCKQETQSTSLLHTVGPTGLVTIRKKVKGKWRE
jgi:hypothetical protein